MIQAAEGETFALAVWQNSVRLRALHWKPNQLVKGEVK